MKIEELEQLPHYDNRKVLPFVKPERTEPKLLKPAPDIEGIEMGGGRHLVCVENDEGHMEYMWLMQDGSLMKAEEVHNKGGHLGGVED